MEVALETGKDGRWEVQFGQISVFLAGKARRTRDSWSTSHLPPPPSSHRPPLHLHYNSSNPDEARRKELNTSCSSPSGYWVKQASNNAATAGWLPLIRLTYITSAGG